MRPIVLALLDVAVISLAPLALRLLRSASTFWGTVILAAVVCAAPCARAQYVNVEASVDRTLATLDDKILLEITIRGNVQNPGQPVQPKLPDFDVDYNGRSQSISIVNGDMTASYSYKYVLAPKREGTLVLPPFLFQHRGKPLRTDPIHITVSSHAPSRTRDNEDSQPSRSAPPSAIKPRAAPATMKVPTCSAWHGRNLASAAPASTAKGIDIILALDVSGSMLAVDMTSEHRGVTPHDVSRLEVSKQAVREFIAGRSNDRIGLVVFAGHALTHCPPTQDYQVLLQCLDEVEVGQIEDGTAMGMALETSVHCLHDTVPKSGVVVLLTDGANNAGTVDPVTAATVAKAAGVKIYTIGVGREENPRFPVETFFGRQYVRHRSPIDEATLHKIAEIGDGKYFRATSPETLREICEEIGRMGRTRVETKPPASATADKRP